MSSGNFPGVSRVGGEGRKVREGGLPELVTLGAVRKTARIDAHFLPT